MKRIFLFLVCMGLFLSGCGQTDDTAENLSEALKKGDIFFITGVVGYSDEPSDIGIEYCFITGNEKIEYFYTDIYNEESEYSSNTFYTRDKDTEALKDYIGQKVTVSGSFDAECHGIPYITDITVSDK